MLPPFQESRSAHLKSFKILTTDPFFGVLYLLETR